MSEQRHALLRSMAVFGGLDDAALACLLEESRDVEVASGERFFSEGDVAEYLIISGQKYRAGLGSDGGPATSEIARRNSG